MKGTRVIFNWILKEWKYRQSYSFEFSMVTADFPWSDIGSWNALEEVMERDSDGNVIEGNVVGIDCTDSIFFTGQKLVAGIGLHDMVVVDTADATLIDCTPTVAHEIIRTSPPAKTSGQILASVWNENVCSQELSAK